MNVSVALSLQVQVVQVVTMMVGGLVSSLILASGSGTHLLLVLRYSGGDGDTRFESRLGNVRGNCFPSNNSLK